MISIAGFSDASLFRFKNDIPYYSVEGNSYLAKFKNGLCFNDVIEFNDFCDYFSKVKLADHNDTQIIDRTMSFTTQPDNDTVEYVFATKPKITREKKGPKFLKKRMQTYRNKMRDGKMKCVEENGGEYCSFMDAKAELDLYQELYERKRRYNQVMAMIKQQYDYFMLKRQIRAAQYRDDPYQYFEKNDIMYYYNIYNDKIFIVSSYVKIPGVRYYNRDLFYYERIMRGDYIHTTIMLLEAAGYYDGYQLYDREEEYGDYERYMTDAYEMDIAEDIAEYYADF